MQLLDDYKEKRVYRKLEEETQECTLWRSHFGSGYGPVIRQTVECTKNTHTYTHTHTYIQLIKIQWYIYVPPA